MVVRPSESAVEEGLSPSSAVLVFAAAALLTSAEEMYLAAGGGAGGIERAASALALVCWCMQHSLLTYCS